METTNLGAMTRREQLGDGSRCMGKGLMQAWNRETGPRYHINTSFVVRTTRKSKHSTAKPKIKKKKENLFFVHPVPFGVCVFSDTLKASRFFLFGNNSMLFVTQQNIRKVFLYKLEGV